MHALTRPLYGAWRRLRRHGWRAAAGRALQWPIVARMPGRSWRGPLPPLTDEERELSAWLEARVRHLAGRLADRNLMSPNVVAAAADWIAEQLCELGYAVTRQPFRVAHALCHNLVAELRGTTAGHLRFVVGAHYDAFPGTPGADDNATGVAAMLALARRAACRRLPVTLRFVAFANEEPPHFRSERMGSLVHARALVADHAQIVGMWSLDSLGYYRPGRADCVAFVGNVRSAHLVRASTGTFRRLAAHPCQGIVASDLIPGIGYSDHWSFWQVGYPALMVTDTAPFRNPHYHRLTDTPDTLDFDRFARVVSGLAQVLPEVAR